MSPQTPQGLDPAVAARRLAKEGPNALQTSSQRTLPGIVWGVLREPMFMLLMAAGLIYLGVGDTHEALILMGFVVIIMLTTVLQERRTDNALEALRDMSSPRATAIRGGQTVQLAGHDVVREDILLLAEGGRVPADGVLLQAHELAIDESMLTGESVPVSKDTIGATVFAGTLVVQGQGMMQVTAIGNQTEIGAIGHSLESIALASSPLQDEINQLTRRLVVIGLSLCLGLALVFWWTRGNAVGALLAGITLAMAVLPQEFPVIMLLFPALAARRMAALQVLTRRLNTIETLGQATVLCVDKTGTLTQNQMTVATLCAGDDTLEMAGLAPEALPSHFRRLLEYAVLASETAPHDPMEQAFHHLAGQQAVTTHHQNAQWALVHEYALSPELLAMSHVWRSSSAAHDVIAAKGAPEAVADLCHLPPQDRQRWHVRAAQLAERGLRVLGVAKALHEVDQRWPDGQHDFVFEWIGLIGLSDPLRPEVPAAVAQCHSAGIRVIMITGDHPHTAQSIAQQAGIASTTVITGAEMACMDTASLAQRLDTVNVFARVKPEQKLNLVNALKARGDVVAMTGDGVNDAPALKAAHIGIAMGQRGTDVAREAASLVLLKDDFSSIVQAIRMGRRTFANMRRAMVYTLAVHIPIIGLSLLPVVFGLPLLLVPLHIAFLELVIDPSCSLVFEAEEASADVMTQPPRQATEPLLSAWHIGRGLVQGLLITAWVMGLYLWQMHTGTPGTTINTMAFVTLVTANAVLILPSRATPKAWHHIWQRLPAVTLWILGSTLAALVLVTSVPEVAHAFQFEVLTLSGWLTAFGWGFSILIVFQLANVRSSRPKRLA
jgi:Ca2+-transporting ATPase